jgi:hypothetical protein
VALQRAARATSAVRSAANEFVGRVRELPQARRILLEESDEGSRIWTVIEAEPFARELRNPIYLAELAVLRSHPSAEVGFRLMNLVEQGATSIAPEGIEVLWQYQAEA